MIAEATFFIATCYRVQSKEGMSDIRLKSGFQKNQRGTLPKTPELRLLLSSMF